MTTDPKRETPSPGAISSGSPGAGTRKWILLVIGVAAAILVASLIRRREYADDQPPLTLSYQQFLDKMHAQRNREEKEKFAERVIGRRVHWECIVLSVKNSAIYASLEGDKTPVHDRAYFYFSDGVPQPQPAANDRVKLSGIVDSIEPPGPLTLVQSRREGSQDSQADKDSP